MAVACYTHPTFFDHDTGPGHPERAARLEAIEQALSDPRFASLDRRQAPAATRVQIERVHGGRHVDEVLSSVPEKGLAYLDPDTPVSPGSREAALHAAGAVCAAVDAVMTGEVDRAFCAVRPPGHHAEPSRAMGFCLFNNVAVGALHARAAHGVERVAVVDFDVHHGNGTQAAFERDAELFYGSTHQYPFYPGTGAASERGVGNVVNLPLAAMSGSAEFRAAVDTRLLPALDAFAPGLVMISAGFDAHRLDPLANIALDDADFAWITEALVGLAKRHCGGRVVSVLEGGYSLEGLASGVAAHVEALSAA